MRILVDATPLFPLKRTYGPTGIGRWISGCVSALGRLEPNWTIDLVIASRSALPRDDSWPSNVALRRIQLPARPYRFLRHLRLLPPIEWLVGPAAVVLGSNYIPPRARDAVEIPVIYDLSFIRYPETVSRHHLFLRTILPGVIRRSSAVLTISQTIRAEITVHYGIEPGRIHVVGPGCDLDRFDGDPRPEESIPNLPDEYFLFVGTLEPRKNLRGLLEAYATLKKQEPDCPPLVLAGGVGWRVRDLLANLRALSSSEVITLGYVPDHLIPVLYARALALVFPSFYEGFGLPALEAMASGCPVIGSNRSAIPEVLGDCGLLVDPYDSASIAAAMKRILDDASLRAQLSQKGRNRARSFTWERTGRELRDVLALVTGR